MTYQLATAKVWDGSQWVAAAGGGSTDNWTPVYKWASGTVTATASSTIHTKGAWIEVVASSAAAIDCLFVSLSAAQSTVDTATLIDIGTGSAGSETAIVSNIAIGSSAAQYIIPVVVYVPASTRISVRIQSIVVSKTATVQMLAFAGPNPSGTSTTATVIGSSTTTSAGTAMSASNNTYVELISSTAAEYESLVLVPSASTNGLTAANRNFDLGIGSSGSEVVVSSVFTNTTVTEAMVIFASPSWPLIRTTAAGSRLAARVSTSANTLDACVIATEVIGR